MYMYSFFSTRILNLRNLCHAWPGDAKKDKITVTVLFVQFFCLKILNLKNLCMTSWPGDVKKDKITVLFEGGE